MRRFGRFAFPVVGLLLAVACAPTPQGSAPAIGEAQKPGQPKRVVAAIQSNPPTLSAEQVGAGSGTLQGGDGLEDLVNGGMSMLNNQGGVVAQVAGQVPSIENGLWKLLPDGRMEMTWQIRPGAVWHDGSPFTAEDLLFSIKLGQDKDLAFFTKPGLEFIEGAVASDPRTVVVTWKQLYIQAHTLFTRRFGSVRPEHVLGPTYQQNKEALPTLTYWNEDFVGAGPYRVRRWVAGSHVVLDANDRFVLGRPKIDEIEVRFIPDTNALAVNILAGEIEVVLGRNLSLKQAGPLRDQWRDGKIAVGFNNWIAVWPQFLNPNPAIMLDVQFRRALYHSIDRSQLVETLQEGLVPVSHTFVSPTEPAYKAIESAIVRYDYDPRRTAQLLDGLGYTRGADGDYRDSAGQLLAVEVRTDGGGGDDEQETAALAVNDAFRRVGISSTPLILTQQQRLDRELNATYPGVRIWRQPNDVWTLDRYASAAAPLSQNRFNGGNRSRYMNPEFDGLVDRYMTTIAERDRVGVLGQIVHHMTDQLNVMGLWYNTEPVPIGNRLQNVTASDVGGATSAWNAHLWDVTR
jgi:peptide/nickel transport system substrate-binding protein